MFDNSAQQCDGSKPNEWWVSTDVEIEEFGGIRVAHDPDTGDAWISGWVDVPR